MFLSIRCLSEQSRLLFFLKLYALRKPLSDLEFVESSCQCRFSSRPIRASPLIAETYNHHAFFVPIHRRPAAIMSGDKEGCDFLHCSPLSHSGFYFIFFFLVTQISDNFFPSCRSALSSSGSATYYLHPETQLRPKVSQTEREQESLTERIRGENSQSCMNEGLKMTQKNCFPCLP